MSKGVLAGAGPLRRGETVFFGGGTASLLRAGDLARMRAGVRDAFGLAGGAIALARSGAGEGRAVAVDGLVGPFGAAAGLLAVLVVLVFTLVLEEGGDDPRRPLWPWER